MTSNPSQECQSNIELQPKLFVNTPDDPLKQEADTWKDKVMRIQIPEPINFHLQKMRLTENALRVKKKRNSNGKKVVAIQLLLFLRLLMMY